LYGVVRGIAENITDVTFYVGIGTFLFGIITFILAVFILRSVRRSVELAEERKQYLREEQERLAFYREESKGLEEALEQECTERLETQRKVERLEREKLREAQPENSSLDQGRSIENTREGSVAGSTRDDDSEETGSFRDAKTGDQDHKAHHGDVEVRDLPDAPSGKVEHGTTVASNSQEVPIERRQGEGAQSQREEQGVRARVWRRTRR
jgi:hypothetical protein